MPASARCLGDHASRIARSALVWLVIGLLFPAAGEARVPPAQLTGTITDPARASLTGVVVTIVPAHGGAAITVVTAAHGDFHASSLEPGTYEVRVSLPGFEPQTRTIVIGEGEVRRLDFVLALAAFREQISVVGTIEAERFEVLPGRDAGARDVGDAIARLAGVSLLRRAAIANDVVVGAYQGENLTVLIDGVRLHGACPNNMDPPTAHADLSEVSRVEIGKGPFDVTNQGSLGGVVNIVTARPARGLHGEIDLAVGSAGFLNPAGTGSYGGSRASGLVGVAFRRGEPYRDGSGRRLTEAANYKVAIHDTHAFEGMTAWTRLYFRVRESDSLHLSYTRQHLDHVLYPYLLMDGIWDVANRATVSYELSDPRGFDTMSVTGYLSTVRHFMTDEFRASATATGFSMGTNAAARTAGVKVQVVRSGLTAGGELYGRNWDATTRFARAGYAPQFALPDVTQITGGAYAALTRRAGPFTLEAGGRVDRTAGEADANKANAALYQAYHLTRATSDDETYASGKFRLTRMYGPLEIGAGIGLTARPPDPQERYYALARQGSDWVGNPGLRPVRNTGVRIDAKYRPSRLFVGGAFQYDFVSNFITPYAQPKREAVPGVVNAAARSFANVDARIAVAELEGSYSVRDAWFVGLTMFATRGDKDPVPALGILSRALAEIPPFRAELSLRHDRGRVFGEAAWLLTARQGRVDADLAERPTPGSGTLTLRAGTRLRHLRATVSLQNAFDRWYAAHLSSQRDPFRSGVVVPEPGRTLHFNVAVPW